MPNFLMLKIKCKKMELELTKQKERTSQLEKRVKELKQLRSNENLGL